MIEQKKLISKKIIVDNFSEYVNNLHFDLIKRNVNYSSYFICEGLVMFNIHDTLYLI